MKFKEFSVSDLFRPVRGKSIYTRAYAKEHPGKYPVYSAGRFAPLATIGTFDHDGSFLSWTTNGYAGYVQVLEGKLSINSDRGILVPLDPKSIDLDYCRLVLQPKLRTQAIGRIIDGKKNEYTKLSPEVVCATTILVPVTDQDVPDKTAQANLTAKYLKIETFQFEFENIYDRLSNSSTPLVSSENYTTIAISNSDYFALQIGNRVLKKDIQPSGIPVYSANVKEVFGHIKTSVLDDFSKPALLWGIDGIFDWNLIPADFPFAPTDHCGVLYLNSNDLDPEYIFFALQGTKDQYGFDRTYRASLENMKEVVTVPVPIDQNGKFDLKEQKKLAQNSRKVEKLKDALMIQLDCLMNASVSFEDT